MVKDVLCRGLEDGDIQMDLLGDKNQDMTLEQVLGFVEAKEKERSLHPAYWYPRLWMQWSEAHIGDRRSLY